MTEPADEAVAAAQRERRARGMLDEVLTSRQMIFVTGKGGVGKSVVSAALALRAKALGLRPVLFECDAPARLSLLPNGKPVGDDVAEVAPGILGVNQKSEDAIKAYAASTLPSKALADLLFENRVARSFLNAAPSVPEMALIGRIASVADKYGADGPVIVDLHATGHALSLLRAPGGIMRVLQKSKGALWDRAQAIELMLQDKKRTAFVTVAVAEELPVSELLELHEKLVELKAPVGPVILNSFVGAPAAIAPEALAAALASSSTASAARDLRFLNAQHQRCVREKARLEAGLFAQHGDKVLTVTLPARADNSDERLAPRLADALARPIVVPTTTTNSTTTTIEGGPR
ncbi:MAG TPA: ArsA-related P-loop ATPase [Myxococcota bacterium]